MLYIKIRMYCTHETANVLSICLFYTWEEAKLRLHFQLVLYCCRCVDSLYVACCSVCPSRSVIENCAIDYSANIHLWPQLFLCFLFSIGVCDSSSVHCTTMNAIFIQLKMKIPFAGRYGALISSFQLNVIEMSEWKIKINAKKLAESHT